MVMAKVVPADDTAVPSTGFKKFAKKLEVAQASSGTYANNHYTSPDLVPMSSDRRTWKAGAFATYWLTGGFAIYIYSNGASLIAYGLSGPQALGASIFSPIILAAACVFCGWVGGSHHISYNVASRASWGMRGTWLAVGVRVMPGLVWDGIEAYWGGAALSTCIGAMSLTWANWDYPLADGTLQLKDFIGFILYYIAFLILMWFPPEKFARPFLASCIGFIFVVVGLLIWAFVNSGGSAGPYFASDYDPGTLLAGSPSWAVVYGMTATLGNVGVVTLGQSDWTRFSGVGNRAPMLAQSIACPLFIFLASALGVVITSAATVPLGTAYWQPYELLRAIQSYHNDSPKARAGVFFASFACFFAQVCVNIILNSTSSAMDLMSYAPKYINIRRGAYFIAAVGFCVCPWQITTSAPTFITVLSGFGIFYGPCSGILVADFWVVRKKTIKLEDLYLGNSGSVYWFWHGVNWRAFCSFFIALVPALPGYIMSCMDTNAPLNNWMKVSRLGYLTGFVLAFSLYILFNKLAPPEGLGVGVRSHDEDTLVLPSAYDKTRPTQGKYSLPPPGDTDEDAASVEKKSEQV